MYRISETLKPCQIESNSACQLSTKRATYKRSSKSARKLSGHYVRWESPRGESIGVFDSASRTVSRESSGVFVADADVLIHLPHLCDSHRESAA